MIIAALASLTFYLSVLFSITIGIRKLRKENNSFLPGFQGLVTVLIPVRNEEQFIKACIRSILSGSNTNLISKIIVIDDDSTDKTRQIVHSMMEKEARISLVKVSDHPSLQSVASPKKRAILCGINLATTEWIALTDGDCIVGSEWINTLTNCITKDTWMVGGPVEFAPVNNKFSKWMHTEFAGFMLVAAGTIGLKKPTTVNGANLLINVKAFHQTGGYAATGSVISGDDELLMQQFHRHSPGSVRYALSKPASVLTSPPQNFHSWINQRLRWASKTTDYPSIWYRMFLTTFWSAHLIFLLAIPWTLMFGDGVVAAILLTKLGGDYLFLRQSNSLFLHRPIQLATVLWTEWLQIFYSVVTGFLGLRRRFEWKGRQY